MTDIIYLYNTVDSRTLHTLYEVTVKALATQTVAKSKPNLLATQEFFYHLAM